MRTKQRRWVAVGAVVALTGAWAMGLGRPAAVAPLAPTPVAAQEQTRTFSVHARKYAFEPGVIEVQQDDLVRIELRADDIPHSFTVDAYRIAKRAAPGQTVTFEFRADQPGSFPFYCDLRADSGCREMRGTLVVRAR